jgi:hypothetical protein
VELAALLPRRARLPLAAFLLRGVGRGRFDGVDEPAGGRRSVGRLPVLPFEAGHLVFKALDLCLKRHDRGHALLAEGK